MTPPLFFLKVKNMKIKAKNSKIASMKLCVPVDGVISIDVEGVANVSPKCAEILVNGTRDWGYVEEKTQAPESVEEVSQEDYIKGLNDMKVVELQQMATEAGLPEDEWGKLTKKLLIAYIVEKTSVDEVEDEEEGDEEE